MMLCSWDVFSVEDTLDVFSPEKKSYVGIVQSQDGETSAHEDMVLFQRMRVTTLWLRAV